jgi:hypothetical protein
MKRAVNRISLIIAFACLTVLGWAMAREIRNHSFIIESCLDALSKWATIRMNWQLFCVMSLSGIISFCTRRRSSVNPPAPTPDAKSESN